MKIVVVGSYKYEFYAPAFAAGFQQLGHEVISVDYEQYHLGGSNPVSNLHNKFQDRFLFGLRINSYNRAIIDVVEKEQPDLVFLYRCYHVYDSTLRAIKGKCVIMSYNNDDPFSGVPSRSYYRNNVSNTKLCDLNYVYRKKNISDYAKIGVNNTKVLLPYYLSWQNKPIKCKKSIPLAFMGHFENDGRDESILSLINAGIPIVVYGDSMWKQSSLYDKIKGTIRPQKRGAEYNMEINKCMICLVFLSKINHDTYTRRCFEIPAAKTMMLSQYTEDLNALFPENISAVYFRSNEDLIRKCKYYLSNINRLNNMALDGYKRLNQIGGSEIDRCREILTDIKEFI